MTGKMTFKQLDHIAVPATLQPLSSSDEDDDDNESDAKFRIRTPAAVLLSEPLPLAALGASRSTEPSVVPHTRDKGVTGAPRWGGPPAIVPSGLASSVGLAGPDAAFQALSLMDWSAAFKPYATAGDCLKPPSYGVTVHMCQGCDRPIRIYARLLPCRHFLCRTCGASAVAHKTCPSCPAKVHHSEEVTDLTSMFVCRVKVVLPGSSLPAQTTCNMAFRAHSQLVQHQMQSSHGAPPSAASVADNLAIATEESSKAAAPVLLSGEHRGKRPVQQASVKSTVETVAVHSEGKSDRGQSRLPAQTQADRRPSDVSAASHVDHVRAADHVRDGDQPRARESIASRRSSESHTVPPSSAAVRSVRVPARKSPSPPNNTELRFESRDNRDSREMKLSARDGDMDRKRGRDAEPDTGARGETSKYGGGRKRLRGNDGHAEGHVEDHGNSSESDAAASNLPPPPPLRAWNPSMILMHPHPHDDSWFYGAPRPGYPNAIHPDPYYDINGLYHPPAHGSPHGYPYPYPPPQAWPYPPPGGNGGQSGGYHHEPPSWPPHQ